MTDSARAWRAGQASETAITTRYGHLTSRPPKNDLGHGPADRVHDAQKFGRTKDERESGAAYPRLSFPRNVIVIVDEAHRSHYDDLDGYARHLRDAVPNATMIAFTGTPVSLADRNTQDVLGDYIDTYDLTRAVDDGATVPVFYESRLSSSTCRPTWILR